ncbi:hypothetical protein TNCV_4630951 [Trichonephila clavipes]|nr:hypothetical protein TNCV_4630951 [Trichonephila clavipes]
MSQMAPQSSDLNPTEHLWDLLERRIRQHNVSSKDMLKSVLKDQWEKISAEKTPKISPPKPCKLPWESISSELVLNDPLLNQRNVCAKFQVCRDPIVPKIS